MAIRAAADVGGTFTDIVVTNDETGAVAISKLPNWTLTDGWVLAEALGRLTKGIGAETSKIETIVIGTTVVTNALLEGSFARTALITTEGFRDILEMNRMERVLSFDLHERRPTPLVPRHLRLEVSERLDHQGNVLRALDENSIMTAVDKLRRENVQTVAVCLLHSYANPDHERLVGEVLTRELGIPVSLSFQVLPVFREYERTMTTVVNAATILVMDAFIRGLESLVQSGMHRVFVMGSEGGCLTLQEARRRPASTVMSGPAGGVIGGASVARGAGFDCLLTLDVGGTSTDVALVQNGRLPFTSDRVVAGYKVALPSVEVETVGAGGGSIAYVDRVGFLKVGPVSAGADPGPICYGRGGTRPTVTDAHLSLGRLGESAMLGGDFALDRNSSMKGIEEQLGKPLGISWVRAARGVLEVVTSNIVRAVRRVSVERGHDPRGLTLVAFGGAGPLHAVDVARSLEIPRVLIPRYPGVWSACGILSADIRYSGYRTWLKRLDNLTSDALLAAVNDLTTELGDRVRADGFDPSDLHLERAIDMRYVGQSHELVIAVDGRGEILLQRLTDDFHAEHELRFGHRSPGTPVEIVNLRASLIHKRNTRRNSRPLPSNSSPGTPEQRRLVWFSDTEPTETPVYRRDHLIRGQVVTGPAIVEQYDSTVVLLAGDCGEVVGDGFDLLVQVRQQRRLENNLHDGRS